MKKTVLVTGANRGIGRAIASRFAKEGFHVIVAVRDATKADDVIQEIETAGGSVEAVTVDMSDPASIEKAAQEISGRHESLDVLVNNAAIHVGMEDTILDARKEDLEISMQTNAFGPLQLVKLLLPLIQASKQPHIVNVSSSVGSVAETVNPDSPYGHYDTAAYRLSKTMLNGITGMLAKTLREDGVKVNAMCPGWTQTDMGGADAPNTPDQAASLAYRLATIDDDGPTGGFFNETGPISW
ncbi:MAG: SDR family NAD(P)-dependent oxidoreductase [Woeseiaceae bacterium]|nr:SDR family NAD(P)-dependent oxidoreductase [Woeseiaceae bacterium]